MDIKEILENETKRCTEFKKQFEQKLIGYLETVGFYETDVRRKSDGKVGRFKVSRTSRFIPYDLCFHLYIKNGELSMLQSGYFMTKNTDMENIEDLLKLYEAI